MPRFRSTAVARNRLRRRLREAVRRKILPRLPALDVVVRSRPDAYRAQPRELIADLDGWRHSLTS